jgi:hypothetical protein
MQLIKHPIFILFLMSIVTFGIVGWELQGWMESARFASSPCPVY